MTSASRSRLLLLVRSLLLALAGAAALGSFVLLDRESTADAANNVYVCPMHPQVRARAPGDCPLCRMALEPVKGAVAAPTARDPEHATATPAAAVLREPVP